MLTSYARIMEEYRRRIRLEAALCARESDRRDPAEVLTWTRDTQARRQGVKDTMRNMEGQ